MGMSQTDVDEVQTFHDFYRLFAKLADLECHKLQLSIAFGSTEGILENGASLNTANFTLFPDDNSIVTLKSDWCNRILDMTLDRFPKEGIKNLVCNSDATHEDKTCDEFTFMLHFETEE